MSSMNFDYQKQKTSWGIKNKKDLFSYLVDSYLKEGLVGKPCLVLLK